MTHQLPAISGVFSPYTYFAVTYFVSIYIYFMRFRIVAKTSSPYLSHVLSVHLNHVYQRGYHWMDFREIWYWGLLKSVKGLQICFNLAHLSGTWRSKVFRILPVTYHSFATTVSQLKISDFSGEKFKGFEVLYVSMSATTTQLLSSGEFYKLRYDTIPVKSASANFFFLYQ